MKAKGFDRQLKKTMEEQVQNTTIAAADAEKSGQVLVYNPQRLMEDDAFNLVVPVSLIGYLTQLLSQSFFILWPPF